MSTYMKTEDEIKKTMTKKELKKKYAMNRSLVGQGHNLGIRNMKSPRDYNRNSLKRELRRLNSE